MTPTRPARRFLSKVPEVTVFFWIATVLTSADFPSSTLGLGLTRTTVVVAALLFVALSVQFWHRGYSPVRYWLVAVLISIFARLLTDNLGVSPGAATATCAVLLAGALAAWYAAERTLSIHTIDTSRREAFYWLTILFAFALGTAVSDLAAAALGLGSAMTATLFAIVIGGIWATHRLTEAGAIAAFWAACVLTRPLGAALGDLLPRPLGTVAISLALLVVIVFLGVSRRDQPSLDAATARAGSAW
ncbi:hypothetical protein [Paractinoplanes lichenicola]|uniref:Membrane-anchored protein n=1 Tax=Paractinoplanes lichenicola TaxID=2802976 RepID=A0ABS1W0H3_9ACTN|nr:hypothetical protein [Actinoplanes lichenicola]MBL7260225.1 hypothetical protein [Actinoplanes lichenicola]